jgi:hypothetical protein
MRFVSDHCAATTADGTLQLWEVVSGELLHCFNDLQPSLNGEYANITCASIAPDGHVIRAISWTPRHVDKLAVGGSSLVCGGVVAPAADGDNDDGLLQILACTDVWWTDPGVRDGSCVPRNAPSGLLWSCRSTSTWRRWPACQCLCWSASSPRMRECGG